ncbi:glycosyltransferase family 2 protein [Methylobacterium soli]|uniref:Glycosyltransferase family 2 protein n=1 Tax=Methylobacterium soli TaxID=553447 RepID=A0A6L3SW17_9HYPH|nr:glycosyltransferase family A protein [Methylobacterium soli]KAB1078020.1 glycosyltransferase family 2 protein [Methylobacterium soli]GJE44291.1 hypothetical protein AEGHOMDF_3479 [Methylobacterium soli]
MPISLIVATLGRVAELVELLASLEAQTFRDFDVIVVDQNADERLAWLAEEGRFRFAVTHLRSSIRHSSHARNLGLQQARGDIIAFPDDDCTYPADLLARIDRAFREDPGLGVRTGPSAAPGGGLGSGRWRPQSGPIGCRDVWTSVIEFNMFIRRSLIQDLGGFDERLGVGSPFGSAEANDLVIRAIQAGWLCWYDVAQLAVHPDKSLTRLAVARAYTYGAGLGFAMRKNRVPAMTVATFLVRPTGGFILNLACGRLLKARYHLQTLRGRIYGFGAYRLDNSLGPGRR